MPWLATYRAAPDAQPRGSAVEGDPADAADPEVAAQAAERFFRRMVGDASWERLPERDKMERRADGPALAAELRAIRHSEPPFDVTTVSVPAVFGRGEHSASRHRDSVTWLVDHTPGAELFEIAGASHGAHLTHPDAFAAMVRSALALAKRRPPEPAGSPPTAAAPPPAGLG
jgi:pimeloyl-ACP methyl ester carboxylesterase